MCTTKLEDFHNLHYNLKDFPQSNLYHYKVCIQQFSLDLGEITRKEKCVPSIERYGKYIPWFGLTYHTLI